jgi:DNA-binding protein HU-beta
LFSSVNKRELVEEIARVSRVETDVVARVVNAFMQVVTRAVVRGEKVVLSGFGTFQRRSRARRTARNIPANEPLPLAATNAPSFRPGKPFKEAVARRRRRTSVHPGRSSSGAAVRRRRAT